MWRIFIILCVLVVIFISIHKKSFPKHIWTYWHDTTLPDFTKKCISTWSKSNPDYEITILGPHNISEYISDDILKLKFIDSPARAADVVRLNILAKYGGVWADATTIIPRSLNWLDEYSSCDYVGYYFERNTTRPEYKSVESWFFACHPGSELVSLWRDEFNSIEDVDEYIRTVTEEGVDLQNIGDTRYLTIYVSFQRVLQQRLGPNFLRMNTHLVRIEDEQHQMLGNIEILCSDEKQTAPVIKFTRFERDAIEKNPKYLECIDLKYFQ
jgi:hypothetical protein